MTARLTIVMCVLLCGTALIRAVSIEGAVTPRTALAELPSEINGWGSVAEYALDAATVEVLNADDYVSRTYARGSAVADLFIAFYASQRQGQAIHSPMNCLPGAGWQPVDSERIEIAAGDGTVIRANRSLIQKGVDQQLVLYWYRSHGRSIASEYTAKVFLVLDSMRTGRSDAALVRIIAPVMRDQVAAERSALDFARSVQPILGRYLPE